MKNKIQDQAISIVSHLTGYTVEHIQHACLSNESHTNTELWIKNIVDTTSNQLKAGIKTILKQVDVLYVKDLLNHPDVNNLLVIDPVNPHQPISEPPAKDDYEKPKVLSIIPVTPETAAQIVNDNDQYNNHN